MEINKVMYSLKNELRREIIKILYQKPMTIAEIRKKLKEKAPVYRQSVNRALDILSDSKLVKKEYSEKEKRIVYSLIFNKITINFKDMTIQTKEGKNE